MFKIRFHQSLENINGRTVYSDLVSKADLKNGDLILIETKNSSYFISFLGNNYYLVVGGWFDRKWLSPAKVRINGCTWGGNIIKTDCLAACGMHLEFDNGLLTSTIQKAMVVRAGGKN
jgi:hypothetical protein